MAKSSQPRMTLPTQAVIRALMENPDTEHYGLELSATAGLPSGTIHPILARLEGCGWLKSRWEDINPVVEGRPRRRYYRLTPNGAVQAGAALARADARAERLARRLPDLAGGAL